MASKHSNTIDFDAAKLQRKSTAAKRKNVLPSATLGELRLQLPMLLQSTLELDRVLNLFFEQTQRLLPIASLNYQHNGNEAQLELGHPAKHRVSYELSHEHEFLGQIEFSRGQRFTEAEQAQLEALLGCLFYPLRNALMYRAAIRSALIDGLTGTGNRIAMEQTLQREVDIARRSLQPLSLLMLDIDHFKQINDRFGHSTGDEALRQVANTLKAQLRNVDMVFRYGGEEFLILLSNTPCEAAVMIGERLRLAVAELCLNSDSQSFNVSISLGCATLNPGESGHQLQERADHALLAAKRGGRNQLRLAS